MEENTASIFLVPVLEHGAIVAFTGKMVYPTSAPENLTFDAKLTWKVIGYNDPDPSTLRRETLLATYEEDFMLTGVSVEQSEGADVGLFYSDILKDMVAADLLLDQQFILNSEKHVLDMPGILSSNGVGVTCGTYSFAHRDEALVSMANTMIPAALETLPDDRALPVTVILEDQSASLDMSDFAGPGNSFTVDLTDASVMTTKTLKTPWYNTSTHQVLSTEEVMTLLDNIELAAKHLTP